MADTPRENKIKYDRFLMALQTLAPTKTFGGVTVPALETQVGISDAPRSELEKIADQKMEQEAKRESADINTMKMCEMVKNGVVADPDFGDDSALYEALGYIRKSERKSGLTRKKTEPSDDES